MGTASAKSWSFPKKTPAISNVNVSKSIMLTSQYKCVNHLRVVPYFLGLVPAIDNRPRANKVEVPVDAVKVPELLARKVAVPHAGHHNVICELGCRRVALTIRMNQ